MNYGSDYADSLVFDSLQVTADAGPNTNEVSTGSASVIIGDPPLDCPSGWPIVAASGESLPIWQGPRGSFSHSAPLEAIDILASSGHSVVATHNGVVERTYPNQGYDRYGKLVFIRGNCNGRIFYSMYAHLTTIGVSAGDPITFGQEIGVSGNTGTGSPHLHYEFRAGSADTLGNVGPAPNNPPFMAPPYLPKEVPEACVTSAGCGVSVP
jgi:murein DD-endopeptidase MepM/ murein hydrolase activator NlpD